VVDDVFIRVRDRETPLWRTVLVGALGRGGPGLFALDVTDPARFATEPDASAQVLWEFHDDDDLGCCTGAPGIAMTHVRARAPAAHHAWAAVFGYGFGSASGRGALYVLFIENGINGWATDDVVRLAVESDAGSPNGLGEALLIDRDRNGIVDLVYAGDLHGNLYRFDVSARDPAHWEATRLFTAHGPDGAPQAISQRPAAVAHPSGEGFVVVFATGVPEEQRDAAPAGIQSVYGIWDALDAAPALAAAADRDTVLSRRESQVVNDTYPGGDGLDDGASLRVFAGAPATRHGWYFDLAAPEADAAGERLMGGLVVRDGTVFATMHDPGTGRTSLLVWAALTGTSPRRAVIDADGDGRIDGADLVFIDGVPHGASRDLGEIGRPVATSVLARAGDDDVLLVRTTDGVERVVTERLTRGRVGRLSWREVAGE
jgi:type IV pilus assembly protein PilY1